MKRQFTHSEEEPSFYHVWTSGFVGQFHQ